MSKQKLFLLLIPIFLFAATIAQAQGIQVPTSGETGLPDGSVAEVLNTILNWLLMIFVIIATISFVVTGLQFIFSFGGASGSEAQAKKNFTYTVIAIFIVGGSLIILKTIIGLLGPVSSGGAGGGNNTPTANTDVSDPYGAPDNYGNDGTANPNGNTWGTNTPQSPGTIPPITNNPSATAGPNGGVYIPDGVYNPSPGNSNTTSNPSATAGPDGGVYIPEGVYQDTGSPNN